MLKKFSVFLDTPAKALASAFVLFITITALDYFAHYQLSFSSFYLLPILIVTWRMSLKYGLAASALSAAVWLLHDFLTMEQNYAHPLIPYRNALIRLIFFVTSTVLLDRVKLLLQKEKSVSKLKSDMLHTLSHEFNNSLTVMSAGLFLLKELPLDDPAETRAELFETLEVAQFQMTRYIKNLLNEARTQEGNFQLEKKHLALRDLAAESGRSAKELLRQKNIAFELKPPATPILVDADKEALALVVSNLLGNAIKYTPQNGKITVEIRSSGGSPARVIFSVEDTGPGLSLEDQKKITGGFYRTGDGKDAAAGFGLGLKTANELLELHGSRLEISSEKGRGSSFFFELPALPPQKNTPAPAAQDSSQL